MKLAPNLIWWLKLSLWAEVVTNCITLSISDQRSCVRALLGSDVSSYTPGEAQELSMSLSSVLCPHRFVQTAAWCVTAAASAAWRGLPSTGWSVSSWPGRPPPGTGWLTTSGWSSGSGWRSAARASTGWSGQTTWASAGTTWWTTARSSRWRRQQSTLSQLCSRRRETTEKFSRRNLMSWGQSSAKLTCRP